MVTVFGGFNCLCGTLANFQSHNFSFAATAANPIVKLRSFSYQFTIMLGVLIASLAHPSELNALIAYKFFRTESNIQRNQKLIANNETKKRCYDFLDKVSFIWRYMTRHNNREGSFHLSYSSRLRVVLAQSFKSSMMSLEMR